MNDTPCYLNGRYLPISQAQVSVLDRGFIFGDGVYDVAPVYDGRLFRFDEHIARLSRSLAKLRIPDPHTRDEWLAISRRLVQTLAEATGARDQVATSRSRAAWPRATTSCPPASPPPSS